MISNDKAILIHGAWQGSWVWPAFIPYLEQARIDCDAIDLPGNGTDSTPMEDVCLELYIKYISQIIDASEASISLIAHSGSGVIATALGEKYPDKIKRIVYIAGMMLPQDMTFADLVAQMNQSGIEPHLLWSEDMSVSSVPAEYGAAIFLNDMDPAKAYIAAQNLTPQATAGLSISTQWTNERFGRIPRLYIECSKDLSVKPEVQKKMQQLVPGAKNVTLEAGHAPQVTAPEHLASAVIDFFSE